ncbi:MAG: alpha-glucan family phosphorylase [Bacteroidales bacterium]|nr:alpha-glucan family phosphorylase [Bacteroidales bacterium]
MKNPEYLFETSWEVCNMVGGIYTVLSTKSNVMRQLLDDHYITVGPDVVKESHETLYFVEDNDLFPEWRERALVQGLKCRIGRWKIESSPIAILVDYTPLYQSKNEILGHLWEQYELDSIRGQWDYIEPVLFGYAAGQVIESFCNFYLQQTSNIVAQFHEWMTGSGVLYLKEHCPQIATVFTTHATYLGRAISGNGLPLYDNLKTYLPSVMAMQFNVVSQQSMEQKAAKNADAFTTVSDITAQECEQFLYRKPDVVTKNGIDHTFRKDNTEFAKKRKATREQILKIAGTLCGETLDPNCLMVLNSGRYEFKNKGIDLFIEALRRLNEDKNLPRTVVAVIAVPSNIAGPSKDLQHRLDGTNAIMGHTDFPATHHVFDYENDAILNTLRNSGLQNDANDKVKVMFVPAYLNGSDGIFNMTYSDFLTAFDFSVFPSYYEPWGYTPLESVALGIPTLTSDVSGFGKFVQQECKDNDAVTVVPRQQGDNNKVIDEIVSALRRFLNLTDKGMAEISEAALQVADKLLWKDLIVNYQKAWDVALEKAGGRHYMLEPVPYADMMHEVVYQKNDTPSWKKVLVKPVYSPEMKKLEELSRNIWWCWNVDAIELFESIDPVAWKATEQNPVAMMEGLSVEQIKDLENNSDFVERLNKVYDQFKQYMSQPTQQKDLIAYFSMEYGLMKSLKIYSGGLGILAGDYMKQASDSNANMVGIGLLYRFGYFAQEITVSGEQRAEYIPQKFSQLPLIPVLNEQGEWVKVSIAFPGRSVYAKAWRVNVGRIGLYLLDTDIEENSPEDRGITSRLYGGDSEMRIKQEMFLGVGGIRLLEAMGMKPTIYHCNEGHAAFSGLERLRVYINKHNLDFDVALELVRASTLFTTHTPVPAGHDAFEEHLIRTYMPHYANRMNISWERFMGLGRFNPNNPNEKFSMSVLATNLSQEVNGVSKIHGRVSREMFQSLWPGYFAEENHIGYVTNGVHLPTWSNRLWQSLYKDTFGPDYIDTQSDVKMWERINEVPDEKIWNIRKQLKHELIAYLGEKIKEDMRQRQESPKLIMQTVNSLNENALVVGFARRFATYKRAHLLFGNLERLSQLVNDPKRPVIFLFAGKAHPNDKAGQDLIKMIIDISRRPEFIGKILFISNYDMELGGRLTSGVDVWLNTPTRPLEASGTSGEKAVMNGVLNFSVLDGWWAEGYRPDAGWAIQEKRTYQDQRYQDEMDAETIYNTLENEIVPLYYARNVHEVPTGWVAAMKKCLNEISPRFTMKRMMDDYFEQYYNKLIERTNWMRANRYQKAFEINAWKTRVRNNWDKVEVKSLILPDTNVRPLTFGEQFVAEITLLTPDLEPGDLAIELLFGKKNNEMVDEITSVYKMKLVDSGDKWVKYYIKVPITRAGVYNFTFRVYPTNAMLPHRQDFPLVKWI